jgi:ergothioneine biosynthesis protein EgtB
LLNVAIEHRLMHAETLCYMFHQLPLEGKHWQASMPTPASGPVSPRMMDIPAGPATLGLSRHNAGVFGWDNEYEANVAEVAAFSIDKYPTTNREFLEFLAAGGYESPAFWTEEDWRWRTEHNICQPAFWAFKNGHWYFRGMFDEMELPPDWPVWVSHAEASAYARWAGKALPTEPQWHRAAYGTPTGQQRQYPWGDQFPAPQQGNFDFQRWGPTPVGAFPECRSAFGVEDLLGNGWEWTSSRFEPFRGFKPFSFYPGYSANFFDGCHYVIKGGSPRTAASMLRRSFRNWFQPRYQYVYAGFRCVAS